MTNNIQGTSHQAISYFSTVTVKARREWHDIFKVIKREDPTTKNTLPSKTLHQIWWRNQKISRQQKLREFSTTKPALQQMLNELIQARNVREGKDLQKNPKQLRQTLIGSYISIITLSVNGLNAPTERHRLTEQIKMCMYAPPLTTSLWLPPPKLHVIILYC